LTLKNIDPLLLEMLEQDVRNCFAFDLSTNLIMYVNQAFLNFQEKLGIPITFSNLLKIVHRDDIIGFKEKYRSIKPGTFTKDLIFRVSISENRQIWICLGLYLNSDKSNPVLSGYFEDISVYKGELLKLNDYANKKSAVLNILAHDLAGPLGIIQMFSQYISEELAGNENPELHRLSTDIQQISKQGLGLIRDYVEAEFIESTQGELSLYRVDVVKPLRTLVMEYQQSKLIESLTFKFVTSNEEVFAHIDKPKFLQAMNNLISNAVKFTPEGGEISIDLEKQLNSVLITVKDTGVGIAQKHHDNLFDKFNSARRPGLKGQPSIGLGMSIIKSIVEWHQGKVWFNSKEHVGTTFYVELRA
jgi:two-component system sensor histidine kinase VicK